MVRPGDHVAQPALALQDDFLRRDLARVGPVNDQAAQGLPTQLGHQKRCLLAGARGVEGNAAWRPGGTAAFGNRSGSLRWHSILAVAGPHCPGELWPTVERSLLHIVDLVIAAQTQTAR